MTDHFIFSEEKISSKEIVSFLRSTEFFGNLSEEALQEVSQKFEILHINSGEVIVQQGEIGNCLFLVIAGRLRAIRQDSIGKEDIILNEISTGELIGELAMLTQKPRTATVIAIRDCILLKLSKQSFEEFILHYPLQMLSIVNSAIERLMESSKKSYYPISTIAIAPASDYDNYEEFAKLFADELSKYGNTLYLNQSQTQKLFSHDITNVSTDFDKNIALSSWLYKQSTRYSYIVYGTDSHYSQWTRRCLRQSDRIILVGHADKNSAVGEIESEVFQTMSKKFVILVLEHERGTLLPKHTSHWLKPRKLNQYHHVRRGHLEDLHSVIRMVIGRGIGLTLGGGGARALAYIGVYQALNELNIPVDSVAGTSFGGLLAAEIALGDTPEVIIEKIKKYIIDNKKMFRLTLPYMSLNSGAALSTSLKNGFGAETYIEDTWKRFFCIACNLNTGNADILTSGLLWKAIRATVSLPGIFPPISNEKGELLIDGAMMNNLPVDVMRNLVQTGKIIAVSTSLTNRKLIHIPEGVLSGWRIFFSRLFAGKNNPRYPSIYAIILNSMGISSLHHEEAMIKQADFAIKIKTREVDLLDFQSIDKLIQIGYFATMEKLSRHQLSPKLNISAQVEHL